jgi:hypothetical protein
MPENEAGKTLSDEQKAKRRRANIVIALALGAFVVLVFIITIVRLGGHVFEHGM